MSWSFVALAAKIYPGARCDGLAWGDDKKRGAVAGEPLICSGCCVGIKCDWAELASSFGFTNWRSVLSPCGMCLCSQSDWHNLEDWTVLEEPWETMDMNAYEKACSDQETVVHIDNDRQRNRLLGCLEYETGRNTQGRLLKRRSADFQGIELMSRLEPSAELDNIGELESVAIPAQGLDVVFWSGAHRIKHRCPFFLAEIGITPMLLLVDLLHAFYLGILKSFAAELCWELILSGGWRRRVEAIDLESFMDTSVQLLHCDLQTWYTQRHIDNPSENYTRIQAISVKMIGKNNARSLALKAAETKQFFFFLVDRLGAFGGTLKRHDIWAQAADTLCRFIGVLKQQPLRLADTAVQERLGGLGVERV
jgi:hypothetical protein